MKTVDLAPVVFAAASVGYAVVVWLDGGATTAVGLLLAGGAVTAVSSLYGLRVASGGSDEPGYNSYAAVVGTVLFLSGLVVSVVQ